MKWFLFSLALIFLSGEVVIAQCSGGSCSGRYNSPPPVLYSPSVTYQWVAFATDDSQVALFSGPYQVGGYSFKSGKYQEYSQIRQEWGKLSDSPPISPPADLAAKYAQQHANSLVKKCSCYPCSKDNCKNNCPCQKTGKRCADEECTCKEGFQSFPTGVETDKIVVGQTTINGLTCQNCKAFEALGAELPDDSGKCFITIIDANDSRRATERAFVDQASQGKFEVQDINPSKPMESWMLDCGFQKPTDSGTTVYAQAPNGKVIWRADKFDQTQITVALRKTDPNYDPRKDPDLNPHVAPMPPQPDPQPAPEPTPEPAKPWSKMAIVAGIIGGAYLLFQKKEGK